VKTSLPSFDGRLRVETVPRRNGWGKFVVGFACEVLVDPRSYRDDMFMLMVEGQDSGMYRVYMRGRLNLISVGRLK
jgi:hypothetical protein